MAEWQPLTQEQLTAIKLNCLGGEEAAARWNDAMNAIHAYAKASGCELGRDVVAHFTGKTAFYHDVMSGAVSRGRSPSDPTPPSTGA